MRNYKITNIDTEVIQYFNYDQLQQFMRINRINFFNKYKIKEIIKTPLYIKVASFLFVSFITLSIAFIGALLDKI
jgi:hypothetical protein|tara:strand:+ start:401 stop:625 length:225 start_codon:yes stop_codon:yes gene_type:complete